MQHQDILLAIFAVIYTGYGLVKWGYLAESDTKALSNFVHKIGVPLLLVKHFSAFQFPDFVPTELWVSYFVPMIAWQLLVFAVGYVSGVVVTAADGIIRSYAATFGNTVILGIPFVTLLFADQGLSILMQIILLHAPVMLTMAYASIEFSTQKTINRQLIFNTLFKNPVFIGVMVGCLINVVGQLIDFSGSRVLGIADQWLDILTKGTATLALLAAGGSLATQRIRRQFLNAVPEVTSLVIIKLVLMPLSVYLLATWVFSLPEFTVMILTLIAALPTGVTPWVVANYYRLDDQMPALVLIISTPISALTLGLMLKACC